MQDDYLSKDGKKNDKTLKKKRKNGISGKAKGTDLYLSSVLRRTSTGN